MVPYPTIYRKRGKDMLTFRDWQLGIEKLKDARRANAHRRLVHTAQAQQAVRTTPPTIIVPVSAAPTTQPVEQ
jgi:hypothetical protein